MSTPNYYGGERPDETEAKRIAELKQQILRVYLTPEARQRLTNVSMVRPEIAGSIENLIVSLASQGKLKGKIDEKELKNLLMKVQSTAKREFRIRRV